MNQLMKDTIIFQEQEVVTHICLILKGHIIARNQGSKVIFSQGSIIGIPDLYIGRYLCEYIAAEDAVIYPFPIKKASDMDAILSKNTEYHGLIIASLVNQIKDLTEIENKLKECADNLFSFATEKYQKYIDYAQQCNISVGELPQAEKLSPYTTDYTLDTKAQQFYLECANIPLETIKEFYSYSKPMTEHHMEEAAGLVANIMIECIEMSSYIQETFSVLMSNSDLCLFKKSIRLYLQLKNCGLNATELMDMVDLIVDEINHIDLVCEQYTNCQLPINRASFEEMYCALLSGATQIDDKASDFQLNQRQILESLNDSLKQILDYSLLSKEKSMQLITAMDYFYNAPDRLSGDDQLRACRKEITSIFYELYESVFTVAYESGECPKAVELFLNYGFLDDRLLTKEQMISLCTLRMDTGQQLVKVYTLREWLTLIYEGKREPSKNEFDLEYTDYIRQQKKSNAITQEEERYYLNDKGSKLQYEIKNMFRVNHKIVHGQISTFVPCLYREAFLNWPDKEFLNRRKLSNAFEQILSIDYSAFYRELLYVNEEAGIEKEYILKEVYPEMILLPIAGSGASMWQEICGKRRSNPGRFLFPIFLNTNLDDIMVRLFGRFRWELCRYIMGTAWNNLKHKSLTSEYVDYLQFYRKNHDLTEERKEKLKLQIQKGRNNSREVFVLDYEAWIKGEANGAIKLNKVARELLATYCPFNKEMRAKLMNQPMFAEAFSRFERNTAKKLHECELRLHAMQKDKIEATQEIIDTLTFYRDL